MKHELRQQIAKEIIEILVKFGIPLENSEGQDNDIAFTIGRAVEERIFDPVNANRKISTYEVYTRIRHNYKSEGGWTLQKLAEQEKVSASVINSIVKGNYWID